VWTGQHHGLVRHALLGELGAERDVPLAKRIALTREDERRQWPAGRAERGGRHGEGRVAMGAVCRLHQGQPAERAR